MPISGSASVRCQRLARSDERPRRRQRAQSSTSRRIRPVCCENADRHHLQRHVQSHEQCHVRLPLYGTEVIRDLIPYELGGRPHLPCYRRSLPIGDTCGRRGATGYGALPVKVFRPPPDRRIQQLVGGSETGARIGFRGQTAFCQLTPKCQPLTIPRSDTPERWRCSASSPSLPVPLFRGSVHPRPQTRRARLALIDQTAL